MKSRNSLLLDSETEDALLESYLRTLESPINTLIEQCADDRALRNFACNCARTAIEVARVENKELLDTISIAEAFVEGKADRTQLDLASTVAEALVEKFEANEFGNDEEVDADTYQHAFDCARAAYSVYACTAKSAKCAAAFACYETECVRGIQHNSEISAKTREMAIAMLI